MINFALTLYSPLLYRKRQNVLHYRSSVDMNDSPNKTDGAEQRQRLDQHVTAASYHCHNNDNNNDNITTSSCCRVGILLWSSSSVRPGPWAIGRPFSPQVSICGLLKIEAGLFRNPMSAGVVMGPRPPGSQKITIKKLSRLLQCSSAPYQVNHKELFWVDLSAGKYLNHKYLDTYLR